MMMMMMMMTLVDVVFLSRIPWIMGRILSSIPSQNTLVRRDGITRALVGRTSGSNHNNSSSSSSSSSSACYHGHGLVKAMCWL